MKIGNEELTMSITKVCPYCERVTQQELITLSEKYKVRNKEIEVLSSHHECNECENEIEDIESADPLMEAYAIYRDIEGYVQPQELVDFRHKYDLTQKELSHMLGFGAVTLSRYENGALQTDAHNVSLVMAMQPNSLKMLVEKNHYLFSQKKYELLLGALDKECENLYCGSSNEIARQLDSSRIDDFSGYSELQVLKLIEVIVYMCNFNGSLKTKLNKLLFYVDFYGYRTQTKSITGLQYIHLPYGPVPDNFDFVYAQLMKEGVLKKEEVGFPNGYVGENFSSNREPDLSLFNEDEIEVLKLVHDKFKNFSSTEITDHSHRERAYIDTNSHEAISYKYADYLEELS